MQAAAEYSHPAAARQDSTTGGTVIPALNFDVAKEIELLHHAEAWQTGISVKRLVRFADFRITLTAMKSGARIELHQNPGRISVQAVDGHIQMHAGNEMFDLPKGRVLVLDRAVPHDVEALADSAFLLTVAQPDGTSAKG